MLKLIFAFDVESIGLHGEGFAVGGGLYDISDGLKTVREFLFSCPRINASGTSQDRKWVDDNIGPFNVTHITPQEIRKAFWLEWLRSITVQGSKVTMFADCCYPVETNFLRACVEDNYEERIGNGPYPLLDLSGLLIAVGLDPLANYERNPNELPKHNPLCDARQSVRKLEECWRILKKNYE